jgi:hypothetical protein
MNPHELDQQFGTGLEQYGIAAGKGGRRAPQQQGDRQRDDRGEEQPEAGDQGDRSWTVSSGEQPSVRRHVPSPESRRNAA